MLNKPFIFEILEKLFHVGNNLINIAFLIKYNLVMLEGQLIFLAAGIINLEVVIYYF